MPPYTVVAGTPARVIKEIDEKTKAKTEIKQELRQLKPREIKKSVRA